jgi:hypothetical protein
MAILIVLLASIAWIKPPPTFSPTSGAGDRGRVDLQRPVPQGHVGPYVYYYERQLTATVNDIEHIESQSIQRHRRGEDLLPPRRRHPHRHRAGHLDLADGVEADAAGITPPLILNYSASTTVPILQMALSSANCRNSRSSIWPERHPLLAGHGAGAAMPSPYGGACARSRSTSIPRRFRPPPLARRCGRRAGRAEPDHPGGHRARSASMNTTSPQQRARSDRQLNNLPIRPSMAPPVTMRDVANVHDGSPRSRTKCASMASARC